MSRRRAAAVDGERAPAGRRRLLLVAGALTLACATAGLAGWAVRGDAAATRAEKQAKVSTVAVVRTDLSTDTERSGTLGYGTPRTVQGVKSGRITWLPDQGATVERNEQLYRVDDAPVVVLYGDTPLFRRLDTVGLVGTDIKVVADNLRALGYDIGTQPAVGTTVTRNPTPFTETAPSGSASPEPEPSGEPPAGGDADAGAPNGDGEPPAAGQEAAPSRTRVQQGDGVLTSELVAAIRRWQRDRGADATGVLDAGDAYVAEDAVRVGALKVQSGADAASEVMQVTSTGKSVSVPVDADEVGTVKRGDKVQVVMPDQTTAPGTVSVVSSVVLDPAGSGAEGPSGPPQVVVTVSLDDADTGMAASVDAATVQVRFTGASAKDVLAVPVGSLLALSEGGYAVQVANGGPLLAVETGLFTKGMVEVTGKGVKEGVKVVTTS
ncbi:hypothetical protein [Streptomyces sp. YS415]|uniref:hypothetical protein n=1 Tax=Streptomyces sp. YS415 TaxID=2944806 RepID=UPI002020C25D|nr:hypothetical protein [Streptomyces sp. YS415]MCL7430318.1 hypothetical protein [Streptomyces sp. YS415]